MKIRELYTLAKTELKRAGIDSFEVDSAILIEHFFKMNRTALSLNPEAESVKKDSEAFLSALAERKARRPLQYILGEWEFTGLSLKVGEGVLIPREDTVVLVESMAEMLKNTVQGEFCNANSHVDNAAVLVESTADMLKSTVQEEFCNANSHANNAAVLIESTADMLKSTAQGEFCKTKTHVDGNNISVETTPTTKKIIYEKPPRGLDLCAGSGAVSLGLCSILPEITITAIELSKQAFPFLVSNLQSYPQYNIQPLAGDILDPALPEWLGLAKVDFIVSNPPYIRTDEMPCLQEEVKKEPALALEAGADGLIFYRKITEIWLPYLKRGGLIAVEIGDTQGEEVKDIFMKAKLTNIKIHKDFNGLDRVVSATML